MTVALGLAAAAAWAVVNLWMVALSRRVDLGVTTLAILASSTVVTLPLALALEGAPAGGAWSQAPAAAAAGLLELAGLGCYILAIRKGSLAIVAPLASRPRIATGKTHPVRSASLAHGVASESEPAARIWA